MKTPYRNEPPTITTMELINNIKEGCSQRGTQMALMSQRLDKLDKTQDKILTKLEYLDDKLEKKFAAKWVQWVVQGLLVTMALSALYVILDNAGLPH